MIYIDLILVLLSIVIGFIVVEYEHKLNDIAISILCLIVFFSMFYLFLNYFIFTLLTTLGLIV